MDLMRSCYVTQARFFHDNPHSSSLKWYFAEKSARDFPVRHAFGNGNYGDKQLASSNIGEIFPGPRIYSKGSIGVKTRGTEVDGPIGYFQQGASWGVKGLDRSTSGIPRDCVVQTGPVLRCVTPDESLHPIAYATDGVKTVRMVFSTGPFTGWKERPPTLFGVAWRCDSGQMRLYENGQQDRIFPLGYNADLNSWLYDWQEFTNFPPGSTVRVFLADS